MKTKIGKFDAATGTVPVRFEHDGKIHERPVNAVLTDTGGYDAKATGERVAEVAAGVEHKFALGLLGNPEPEGA